jgi:hypothetical protein
MNSSLMFGKRRQHGSRIQPSVISRLAITLNA